MAKKKAYQEVATQKEKKQFAPFLADDEELILVTGYGKVYMRQKFIIYIGLPGLIFILGAIGLSYYYNFDLIVATLIGFAIAILFAAIKCHFLYNAHRYLLTTRRVLVKGGYFSVKINSALYDKITHIEVAQSLLDRWIMQHGSIIVHTAGSTGNEIRLDYVDNPIEFKNLLERLINSEREHFGRGGGASTGLP